MLLFAITAIRSGVRSRSFWAAFFLGLLLIFVAWLSGHFSPRQPQTVALDVGFSGLRFSVTLLALFWVQDLVGREIDRRTVMFSLAYPVPRSAYVLGRFLGIAALSGMTLLLLSPLLWLIVKWTGGGYVQQFPVDMGIAYWGALLGIWINVLVVTAFSLWIACISTVSPLPLVLGLAFAVGGQSIGPVREYLMQGADGDAMLVARFNPILEIAQWVLPDLSRLDWRVWPMYAQQPDLVGMALGLTMGVGYGVLMLFLAVRGFSRREFT